MLGCYQHRVIASRNTVLLYCQRCGQGNACKRPVPFQVRAFCGRCSTIISGAVTAAFDGVFGDVVGIIVNA